MINYNTSTDQYGPSSSSARFKQNIEDITDAEVFYELEAKEFDFIKSGNHSIGFIAEEVDEHIPLAVPKKNGQPVSVKYDLLGVYVAAEMNILYTLADELLNKLST